MRFPHGETVTRLRGTTESDGYGGTRTDWSDPDELDIYPCAVAPLVEEELLARGREGITEAWTVYAPYKSDIRASDRIRYDGMDFDVDGVPGNWRSPFTGSEFGMAVRIVRIEG